MSITIKRIDFGSEDYKNAVKLRTRVLRDPLGLKYSPEELSKEDSGIHLAAFSSDQLLGFLMLVPLSKQVLKMRQVAVDPSAQGKGIGKKLVLFSEGLAKHLAYEEIDLHARETAIPFYLALGYSVYGEPFTEVTLPHRKMRKRLAFS